MRAPEWLTSRPIAHRGLHDLARGVVENMPAAFDAAIAAGYAIETDLQISGDGEAMVHHDYALGRLTEGEGLLRDKSTRELHSATFQLTPERMMTFAELCERTAGRVPLVVELKSYFDDDIALVQRAAKVLEGYRGAVALMSFDPAQVMALRDLIPDRPRGITAERSYEHDEWAQLSPERRHGMTALRHAFKTQPHFVAYRIDDLPSPAPWIARNVFGCTLLTWTVRTDEQRARAAKYADQMIFEGFRL